MKKTYKIVTLLLTAVFLLGTFILPISAGAATVIDITAEITGRTTLYAGEVFVDGESDMRYLYSDDVTLSKTVMEAIAQGFGSFADGGFASLVPDLSDGITGSGEPASGKIYKAVLEFQQGGTRTEKVSEETDIAAYIAEKKSAFEAATAGGGSSDIIVEQNGYEAFFTENTYAEIYMFEYVGTICKLSDDAIFIGDIDDFDNLYVVSGTVTREQHYRVYYELVTVTKEESEPDWTPGDINGDGFADNKDVVTLFRHLTGYPDKVITAALDCNGDGLSDNKDVTVLFRYVSTNFRSFISDKPYKEA